MNLTESALENWCLGTWEHIHSLTFKYLVTSLCFMSSSLTFHNICFSTGIRYHILPYCIHLTQQCMETLRVYQAERPTFKNLSEAVASRSKEIHALFMFIYTTSHILIMGSSHFHYCSLYGKETHYCKINTTPETLKSLTILCWWNWWQQQKRCFYMQVFTQNQDNILDFWVNKSSMHQETWIASNLFFKRLCNGFVLSQKNK